MSSYVTDFPYGLPGEYIDGLETRKARYQTMSSKTIFSYFPSYQRYSQYVLSPAGQWKLNSGSVSYIHRRYLGISTSPTHHSPLFHSRSSHWMALTTTPFNYRQDNIPLHHPYSITTGQSSISCDMNFLQLIG
jgi:hypothetical protein